MDMVIEEDVDAVFRKLHEQQHRATTTTTTVSLMDTEKLLTPKAIHAIYNHNKEHTVNDVKSEDNIKNAFKKFHAELLSDGNCSTTEDSQSTSLDAKSFQKGIREAHKLLMQQSEQQREETFQALEKLCLQLSSNEPRLFADLLDLPGALMTEDILALMNCMQ
jgi:hypothetical protein